MIESKPTPRDTGTQSRIPVLTGETQSPSPAKKPQVTGTSPTISEQSTPTKRKLPTPGGVGQAVKEAPQARTVQKEENRPQSVPSVTTEDQDSEVCYVLTLFTDSYKFLWRQFGEFGCITGYSSWWFSMFLLLSDWQRRISLRKVSASFKWFIGFISFILHTDTRTFGVTLHFQDFF